jgi:hypothetical protein
MDTPDAQLIKRLKIYQAGANAHTVNKARYYYTGWSRRKVNLDVLETMIRTALATHDWTPLRLHMRRWW